MLRWKYSWALATSSSAFSWKPNGVSMRAARAPSPPTRSMSSRWTGAMVGAVSPEPMMQRMRAAVIALILRSADGRSESVVAGRVTRR